MIRRTVPNDSRGATEALLAAEGSVTEYGGGCEVVLEDEAVRSRWYING